MSIHCMIEPLYTNKPESCIFCDRWPNVCSLLWKPMRPFQGSMCNDVIHIWFIFIYIQKTIWLWCCYIPIEPWLQVKIRYFRIKIHKCMPMFSIQGSSWQCCSHHQERAACITQTFSNGVWDGFWVMSLTIYRMFAMCILLYILFDPSWNGIYLRCQCPLLVWARILRRQSQGILGFIYTKRFVVFFKTTHILLVHLHL